MAINSDKLNPIEPIHPNQGYEEHHDGRKRRKVTYQGRSWGESEDELAVQPRAIDEKKSKTLVCANREVMERAQALISELTTLEDKVATLLFFETEAYYDKDELIAVNTLLQKWKIGGLLFTKGDYKRQLYLIEQYQKLAKLPFLMGNDFIHSLFYYFRDDVIEKWGIDKMDAKYFADLGKAVVFQNRRLGIHFQLSEKRKGVDSLFTSFPLTEAQMTGFKKGIRDAHGIIGLFGQEQKKLSALSLKGQVLVPEFFPSSEVTEVFSLKSLSFLDITTLSLEEGQEKLLSLFLNHSYDAFLLSLSQEALIPFLTLAIKEGKISEKEFEKKLIKILALKSYLFRTN